ncbi:MAG: YdeI/OmpD-associated family protein [Methylocella sp.]
MGELPDNLPVLEFSTPKEFEVWLAKQSNSSTGVWLKFAKKTSGVQTISKQDAIDCALCHGWIDGQLDKLDEKYWLIRFTPRKATGKWSKNNRIRATELISDGRMKEFGLAEITRAKADGRWDAAYSSQSRATVPADLQRALDESDKAKASLFRAGCAKPLRGAVSNTQREDRQIARMEDREIRGYVGARRNNLPTQMIGEAAICHAAVLI